MRDSSTGRITGNTLLDNCSGLVFLNTGIGTSGVQDWVATDNTVTHNNKSKGCLATDTGLPFNLTGLGILIAGGQHIVLQHKCGARESAGRPADHAQPCRPVWGIVVVSTAHSSVFSDGSPGE